MNWLPQINVLLGFVGARERVSAAGTLVAHKNSPADAAVGKGSALLLASRTSSSLGLPPLAAPGPMSPKPIPAASLSDSPNSFQTVHKTPLLLTLEECCCGLTVKIDSGI